MRATLSRIKIRVTLLSVVTRQLILQVIRERINRGD